MCKICNNEYLESKELIIDSCNKLTYNIFIKYTNINNISSLIIKNCLNLNMVPIINKLYKLNIDNCPKITFILINTNLKYLTINNCINLETIPIIDALYYLYIFGTENNVHL